MSTIEPILASGPGRLTIQPLKSIGGRLPEIARSRLEFPSREKMMGWALTRWRALTRYSTVHVLSIILCKNRLFNTQGKLPFSKNYTC